MVYVSHLLVGLALSNFEEDGPFEDEVLSDLADVESDQIPQGLAVRSRHLRQSFLAHLFDGHIRTTKSRGIDKFLG